MALSLGGALTLAIGDVATASAAAPNSPNWTTLVGMATKAIASYDGAGTVSASAPNPSSDTPSLTINGQSVSVAQASFVAKDSSGSYATDITWLGGKQLLVNVMPEAAGSSETTELTLTPGTSNISSVAHSHLSVQTVQQAPGGPQPDITISYFWDGNCEGGISSPGVEGSIYGPLVFGSAAFVYGECPDSSASIIIGLYYWNGSSAVGLNDTQGASGNPYTISATAYYPCSSGGPTYFESAGLFQASGQPLVGEDSQWSLLSCAA